MSQSSAVLPVAVPRARVRFDPRGSLLVNELRTMFRRNRNLALLAALPLIPVALGVAVKLGPHHRRRGDGGLIAPAPHHRLFPGFAPPPLPPPVSPPLPSR